MNLKQVMILIFFFLIGGLSTLYFLKPTEKKTRSNSKNSIAQRLKQNNKYKMSKSLVKKRKPLYKNLSKEEGFNKFYNNFSKNRRKYYNTLDKLEKFNCMGNDKCYKIKKDFISLINKTYSKDLESNFLLYKYSKDKYVNYQQLLGDINVYAIKTLEKSLQEDDFIKEEYLDQIKEKIKLISLDNYKDNLNEIITEVNEKEGFYYLRAEIEDILDGKMGEEIKIEILKNIVKFKEGIEIFNLENKIEKRLFNSENSTVECEQRSILRNGENIFTDLELSNCSETLIKDDYKNEEYTSEVDPDKDPYELGEDDSEEVFE